MVMDEVVTFRTGYARAQGIMGVEPDITFFGKAFGGGLPVGVIGGKEELMSILDNSGEPTGLSQSGTFSGNSFTLPEGLATLRALTPEVYEHIDTLRGRLHQGLLDVFGRAVVACQVLSEGAAVSLHLTDRPVTDYRSATTFPDHGLAARVNLGLFLKGYSLRSGIQITLSQPMWTEYIDGFLQALDQVLAEGE